MMDVRHLRSGKQSEGNIIYLEREHFIVNSVDFIELLFPDT